MYSYPDVPESEDAFGYFPHVAAKLLAETVVRCGAKYECVREEIKGSEATKNDGSSTNGIVLKKIQNRRYVRVSNG